MPTFDGDNLTITLDSGVSNITAQDDLYEEWKDWMLASPLNRRYPNAFRTIGGDPLTDTIDVGSYFFINNAAGWRIRPPEEDITILVVGNLAAEDPTLPVVLPTIGDFTVLIVGIQQVSQGVSSDAIAKAVWDDLLIDHEIGGTFGGEVATKADIQASAATDYESAASGVATEGSVITGTYASTVARDGIYWQIDEDASTGITVDMTFNLPSVDHRPGVFRVFGRYNGFPSTTHYQELWAWNYETADWEMLTDDFMPGGNATDSTYEHEYYERHVDRDNNNEVQIRIKHHITSYNANHALYLDYAGLSSIEILTAEDIATAVWASIAEGSYTQGELQKLISAALAGKLSGAPGGPIVIRDLNDLKDRITAAVDANGNRTGVTLNVS